MTTLLSWYNYWSFWSSSTILTRVEPLGIIFGSWYLVSIEWKNFNRKKGCIYGNELYQGHKYDSHSAEIGHRFLEELQLWLQ